VDGGKMFNRREQGKLKAKKVLSFSYVYKYFKSGPREFGMLIKTRKRCSCYMCGNPRKFQKGYKQVLTMQERKKLDDFNDQIKNYAA
jgi:hypothetical protein